MTSAQRLGAAILAAMVLATAVGASQAQTPYQTYRAVVAAYLKTRDVPRVVEPLQPWSAREFDEAIKATVSANVPGEIKAAAILHLEIAVALVGVNAAVAGGHVSYGQELLDRWTATQPRFNPSEVNDQKQFRATWLAVAGSAFAAVKDAGRARRLLNKSLDTEPRSARTQTLIGTLKEFEAVQFNPEDSATVAQRERLRRERLIRLYQAERDYLVAIRFDPNYALAHIRLGRVQDLTGKPREARASLARGQKLAGDPLSKYLSALFIGVLQQADHDVAAARRSFEQAVAIAPSSQPAAVALAHLEVMAGRPDRANALARGLAGASARVEPWWAFHNGGLDITGLRWLREHATQ